MVEMGMRLQRDLEGPTDIEAELQAAAPVNDERALDPDVGTLNVRESGR